MSRNGDNSQFAGGISAEELMENDFCDNSQSNIFVGDEKLEPFLSMPSDQKQEEEPIGLSEFDLVETPTIAPPAAPIPKRCRCRYCGDSDITNIQYHTTICPVRLKLVENSKRIARTAVVSRRFELMCRACGSMFTRSEELHRHMQHCPLLGRIRCSVCKAQCWSEEDRVRHVRTAHHVQAPSSSVPGSEVNSEPDQTAQTQKPNQSVKRMFKFKCKACEMIFYSLELFKEHKRHRSGCNTGTNSKNSDVSAPAVRADASVQRIQNNEPQAAKPQNGLFHCTPCRKSFQCLLSFKQHKQPGGTCVTANRKPFISTSSAHDDGLPQNSQIPKPNECNCVICRKYGSSEDHHTRENTEFVGQENSAHSQQIESSSPGPENASRCKQKLEALPNSDDDDDGNFIQLYPEQQNISHQRNTISHQTRKHISHSIETVVAAFEFSDHPIKAEDDAELSPDSSNRISESIDSVIANLFSKHHESDKVLHTPRINKNGRIPGNYPCHQCDKVFPYASHLRKHRSTHAVRDRMHLCDVCGKTFTSATHLRCHKRLHTGEKPFQCDKCEYKCAWRSSIMVHKRTHLRKPKPYKPNPKFKYICDDCEMRFRTPCQLGIHVRKHTGARPFRCNFCNKRFAHVGNLVVHERRHTGEKPFVCDICGRGWPDSTSMKGHRRTHLGVGETESRSPSPISSEESRSPSSTPSEESRSPSPTSSEESRSPSPTSSEESRSPSPTSSEEGQSPSPTLSD